jgi:enterochelin esterase family protein
LGLALVSMFVKQQAESLAVPSTRRGFRYVAFESPGTSHEWQTWRRSLYDFAPRLFRD